MAVIAQHMLQQQQHVRIVFDEKDAGHPRLSTDGWKEAGSNGGASVPAAYAGGM
jgi:hypothetical protein